MGVVESMETIVPVTIGVLSVIFVAALIALVVVCKHQYCRPIDYITREHMDNDPSSHLVTNMECCTENCNGVEMDDVHPNTDLDTILENEAWVNDVTGLAPHCLAILKTAHLLTERLVGITLNTAQQLQSPEILTELVTVARRIGPRVDDVVNAMYPPLDPRLLEARCSALVLSVSHLVLLTKNACRLSTLLDWVDQSLADVEDHLQVLREASIAYESQMVGVTVVHTPNPAGVPVHDTQTGSPNQPAELIVPS